MECSWRYCRNTSEFDQPVSDTLPTTEEVAPLINFGSIRFHAKRKKVGIATPPALPQPIFVVVLDCPAVTDKETKSLQAAIYGCLWSCMTPFSSTLIIRCGVSFKSYLTLVHQNNFQPPHLMLMLTRWTSSTSGFRTLFFCPSCSKLH